MVMDGPSDTNFRLNALREEIFKENGLGTKDELGNITFPPKIDELFYIAFHCLTRMEGYEIGLDQIKYVAKNPPLYIMENGALKKNNEERYIKK